VLTINIHYGPTRLSPCDGGTFVPSVSNMGTDTEMSVVADVRNALAGLSKVELADLSDLSLLDLARQLRPLVCQLQAVEIQLVGTIDVRRAAAADGSNSTTAWLRSRLRVADAATRVKSARALARMPRLACAFAAGEVSPEHVGVAARVSAGLSDEALSAGADELLVDQARQVPPSRFTREAARIRDQFDPADIVRRPKPPPSDRWLHARRAIDGGVTLTGRLDPSSGTELLAALDTIAAQSDSVERRPLTMRRADALLSLCRDRVSVGGHSLGPDTAANGLPAEAGAPGGRQGTAPIAIRAIVQPTRWGIGDAGPAAAAPGSAARASQLHSGQSLPTPLNDRSHAMSRREAGLRRARRR
jgi:Domain of unknown function (DUF222)